MIVWMLYSAIIALIVAAAARAAEWLARLAGYRVRWVWVGALVLAMSLSASALWHKTKSVSVSAASSRVVDRAEVPVAPAGVSWRTRIDDLQRLLGAPLRVAGVVVHRAVSPAVNVYVASLSVLASIGLTLVLIGVARRFRNARREWPLIAMQGVDVRVAPHIGPLVVGVVRPEIVVPRWLLARCADEQRLVVAHEEEHVRAGDPLLLWLAWSAVVIAPWNPAIWYMLSRLRLAVELDCDARVLRRGATPQSYGSLLIDVAQSASPFRLSALALVDDSSHLRQRLLAMKPSIPRFARLRGGLAASFAAAALVGACQAAIPTDAEIATMDGAAATRAATALAKITRTDTLFAYTVDGVPVSAAQASAIEASKLASLRFVTGGTGQQGQINIVTLAPLPARIDSGTRKPFMGAEADAKSPALPRRTGSATVKGTPLIFIDGVRSTQSAMMALDKESIESIDVVKGPSAAREYSDPDAANGVIAIKTKHGGGA